MQDATLVLGFDMETDVGSWTPFYEGLKHATPKLLDLLAGEGVQATFFFVGDAARRHPEVVRDVQAAGHEVGCHSLYHETIGDPLFEIPGMAPLLPHEVRPRIELATQLVADAAGREMASFRCPRLFGGTNVVNALEDLGYLADATLPMYYYEERIEPYHPSREDWTQVGDSRVLEIPVFADMTVDSKDEYGRDRDQWPLFRTEGAGALLQSVENFAGYARGRGARPVCCFYFHPWEFHEMPKGPIHYGEGTVIPDPFIVKNCGQYALEQLGIFVKEMKGRGARFATCEQLARQ